MNVSGNEIVEETVYNLMHFHWRSWQDWREILRCIITTFDCFFIYSSNNNNNNNNINFDKVVYCLCGPSKLKGTHRCMLGASCWLPGVNENRVSSSEDKNNETAVEISVSRNDVCLYVCVCVVSEPHALSGTTNDHSSSSSRQRPH